LLFKASFSHDIVGAKRFLAKDCESFGARHLRIAVKKAAGFFENLKIPIVELAQMTCQGSEDFSVGVDAPG
jgi:hypothetical protein